MSALAPGTEILGKYRIDRVIGKGGMGIVAAAHHLRLDQRVAIKMMQPEYRDQGDLTERFLREARAATRIEGEHVARVLDVDVLEDGTPFMVMEYLEGHDLSSVRASGVALDVPVVVRHVAEACSALGQAHTKGIVHRDLKPANLFLTTREEGPPIVKVLDFGISKISSATEQVSITTTAVVMGSAEYMSPEQMLSTRDVDARADIWALGVILYELLTARIPFPGETVTQVCALVMSKPPAPPRSIRPAIPQGLEDVVLRCLAKEADARYQNVSELVAALRPFADADDYELIDRVARRAATNPGGPAPRPSSATLAMEQLAMAPTAFGGAAPTTDIGITADSIPRPGGLRKAWVVGASALLVVGSTVALYARSRASDPDQVAASAAATALAPPAASAPRASTSVAEPVKNPETPTTQSASAQPAAVPSATVQAAPKAPAFTPPTAPTPAFKSAPPPRKRPSMD